MGGYQCCCQLHGQHFPGLWDKHQSRSCSYSRVSYSACSVHGLYSYPKGVPKKVTVSCLCILHPPWPADLRHTCIHHRWTQQRGFLCLRLDSSAGSHCSPVQPNCGVHGCYSTTYCRVIPNTDQVSITIHINLFLMFLSLGHIPLGSVALSPLSTSLEQPNYTRTSLIR